MHEKREGMCQLSKMQRKFVWREKEDVDSIIVDLRLFNSFGHANVFSPVNEVLMAVLNIQNQSE